MENLTNKIIENTFKSLESAQSDFEIGLVSVSELVKGLIKENEDLKNQIEELQFEIRNLLDYGTEFMQNMEYMDWVNEKENNEQI